MTRSALSSVWDHDLTHVIDLISTTTEHGAPPPCDPAALFALDGFARCMNYRIPAGYSRLLAIVNGLSIPGVLRICGIGIPVMDRYDRLDFLLINQGVAAVPSNQPRRTIFGLFGPNADEIISLSDTREFMLWNRRQQIGDVYPDFDSMIASILSGVVAATQLAETA